MLRAVLGRSGLRLLAERAAMGKGVPGAAVGVPGAAVGVPGAAVIRRQMCDKPEDDGRPLRTPAHRPTDLEKKMLLWSGRFKKESDIPEFVSFEMVDAAKGKLRVKMALMMMLLTIVGCITMIISGKRAAKRHETLTRLNLEKKAQLKSEAQD